MKDEKEPTGLPEEYEDARGLDVIQYGSDKRDPASQG